MGIRFELCLDSIDGVRIAVAAGVDRVELCASLVVGGTTPSQGMIELAREIVPVGGLVVLIRPRGGDFLCSDDEFSLICRDVVRAREIGVDAVAIGMLRADGTINKAQLQAVIDLARPMQVTFHRAYDMTRDPLEALDTLMDLGVDRVLTSGQAQSAMDGIECIAGLVQRAGDEIGVLPAGGIRPHNVARLVSSTGVAEVHASAAALIPSSMEFRNPSCSMGTVEIPGEFDLSRTSLAKVEAMQMAVRAQGT